MRKVFWVIIVSIFHSMGVIAMDSPNEWCDLSEGVSITISSSIDQYRLCDGFGCGKPLKLVQFKRNEKWENIDIPNAQQIKIAKLLLALKQKSYSINYANSVYISDGEFVEVNIKAGMCKLTVIDDFEKIACRSEIKTILAIVRDAVKNDRVTFIRRL